MKEQLNLIDQSQKDGDGKSNTMNEDFISKDLRHRFLERFPTKNSCRTSTKKFIRKKLPIMKWLPLYNKRNLYYDFIAGITVGLMLVPQSLAYSALAGLSPEYGLYSSYCGVLVYFLFGTSKDLQTGPAALVAMLVNKYTQDGEYKVMYATSLALFSGIVLIFLSLFRLQFLVNFISVPVLAGFTSAAAIKIGVSQLKGLFGLSVPRGHFFHTVYDNFSNIKHARVADSVLGFTCLFIFIVLRAIGNWNRERRTKSRAGKICKQIIWFVCTARFTLLVLITTVVSQILYECFGMEDIFILAGNMTSGIPSPQIPLKDIYMNGTCIHSKFDIVKNIGIGCIMTPFVAFLETVAVAKTLSRKNNYKIDVKQELFSLGVVNVIGSFFSAFPVAGSFSRSALNSQCSVKTQLGGFFTGVVVLLAASFLTPWFKYIPKATLSAMIIAAVIPLFEYHIISLLWRTKKIEFLATIVTFFLCFYETEVGILAGVAVALGIYLYESIQLKLSEDRKDSSIVVEIGSQGISYPNVDQLITKLDKIVCGKKFRPNMIVLDLKNVIRIDSTAAASIKQFSSSLQTGYVLGPKMIFRNTTGMPKRILERIGVILDEEEEPSEEVTGRTVNVDIQIESQMNDPYCFNQLYPKMDEA